MGKLELNEAPGVYEDFYGRITDKLPELRAQGRTLMSGKTLMERRLGSVRDTFRNNYFHIDLSNVRSPTDEEVKVVLSDPLVDTISPQSNIVSGGLVISPEDYAEREGLVISGSEARELQSNVYALPSKRQAFWELVAEGDTQLLTDYRKEVARVTDKPEDKVMGVYPSLRPGLRLWFAGRLSNRSYADGGNYLGSSYGRLVGVAPEAHATEGRPIERILESRIATAISKGQKFERKDGLVYTPVEGVTIAK